MVQVMYASKFVKVLSRVGKPVVVRKQVNGAWVDYMAVAEIQQGKATHELTAAGVLEAGDAVAYFPPWSDISNDDRVILNHEYVVESVSRKQVGDETVYIHAFLKRVHETVQASFHGPNRVFFDDFDVNRELWTEKSGSWAIQDGKYVGEAPDALSSALSVAGQEYWDNYVLEALVTVEYGDAGLICRFSSPSNDQYYIVSLRVEEDAFALEGVKGERLVRLKMEEINLNYNQQYSVRVHCFGGFIMLFLDGAYVFTVSDLAFKTGKIGLAAFGGKAEFDNVSVWSD